MIHDELISLETAKLARKKGFKEGCLHYYQNGIVETDGCYNHYNMCKGNICSAPTQSLLQRWLREERGIHIGIGTDGGNDWCYITVVITTGHTEYNTNIFPTYEQALEDGLKYALEKLV